MAAAAALRSPGVVAPSNRADILRSLSRSCCSVTIGILRMYHRPGDTMIGWGRSLPGQLAPYRLEVAARGGVRRVRPECRLELPGGGGEVACPSQENAEVIADVGVARVQRDQ